MDFKQKYLKYKQKYINLKKLIGGAFETNINLVAVRGSPFLDLVSSVPDELLVYNNSFLQDREIENLKKINDDCIFMYTKAKNDKRFILEDFVNLYDKIGILYICTQQINNLWNELANDVRLNINIFIGDGDTFMSLKDKHYQKGVNILFGCSTQKYARNLNTIENNSNGKYFIGFNGYIHSYGSSIYWCKDKYLKITIEEFINEYEEYAEEYPINKIIKMFYNRLHHCKINTDCRNCNLIILSKIKEKLLKLKPNIEKKLKFSIKDSYINSNFHIKCDTFDCRPDTGFENYIRDTMKIIDEKEKLEILKKSEDQLEEDKIFKSWSENAEKLITNTNINNDTTETDITQEYKNYFFKINWIEDILDNKKIKFNATNNYFEIIDHLEYDKLKIFLIKRKSREKIYFKFILYKLNRVIGIQYYDYFKTNLKNNYFNYLINVSEDGNQD
jgi:hypothetical protein